MKPTDCGLPHREPFVFIDDVLEITPGHSAKGVKTFPPDEPFFRGHFPGNPLVPGVILTEALAQIAGIAAGQPGRLFHLAAVKGMKFLKPVRPGERIELAAIKTAETGRLLQFAVTASVEGDAVADGSVVLGDASGSVSQG